MDLPIPADMDDPMLPDPETYNYWKMYQNRIFYIDCEIDESVLEIQKSIISINIEDKEIEIEKRKPIVIMINTMGGLLQETMSLATTCIMSKTPIITVNIGAAYSGGSLLLLAGHKRYAMKYSKAMIHSGSTTGGGGTFEQSEAAQKLYKKQIDEMAEYILERSSIEEKVFKRNKSKDWYFTTDEQVQYGLVDSILESLDDIF